MTTSAAANDVAKYAVKETVRATEDDGGGVRSR